MLIKHRLLTLIALIFALAFSAAALPTTPAKQVSVAPASLGHSSSTNVQGVLEDLDELIPATATTGTVGTVRFSTPAEVAVGTGTDSVITPADLKGYVNPDGSLLIATNGYYVMPGGLIFQWGVAYCGGATTVTFPTNFPNACLNVVVTQKPFRNSGSDGGAGADGYSFSGFTVTQAISGDIAWQAVGY
jgi:hypothetical protein